jgi:RimJ/RimL family protein N-acetyltransferase
MNADGPMDLKRARVPVAGDAPYRRRACSARFVTREGVAGKRGALSAFNTGDGQVVRLADGAMVRLRMAHCDDDGALRHMFLGLSDRTRYLYFCAGVPASESWAGRFAALGHADWQTSYAFVAEPGQALDRGCGVIGLARLVRSADGQSAEIGILLADAWQSRGLGRFVLQQLCVEAHRLAVAALTGNVLWENQRMMRLARRVFPHLELTCTQGVCELRMALNQCEIGMH